MKNVTAQELLAAVREGKISAIHINGESVPVLAGGDSSAYPKATIRLEVDGETVREIECWKHVYRAKGNDPLTGRQILPPGSWEELVADRDGCTRGDIRVVLNTAPRTDYSEHERYVLDTDDEDADPERTEAAWLAIMGRPATDEERQQGLWSHLYACVDTDERPAVISFETGEGCDNVEHLNVHGLLLDEAREVYDAIEKAINEAYEGWQPQTPTDDELYDALVSGRHCDSVELCVEAGNEEPGIRIYGCKHLEQPLYAIDGDPDKYVYSDAQCAVDAAAEILANQLREAADKLEESLYRELADKLRTRAEEN